MLEVSFSHADANVTIEYICMKKILTLEDLTSLRLEVNVMLSVVSYVSVL